MTNEELIVKQLWLDKIPSKEGYIVAFEVLALMDLARESEKKKVLKEVKKTLESLISSKSSDYNKGVQDCINILTQHDEKM